MNASRRTPSKRFNTILIDPPWFEQGAGKSKRGADRHYPLLKTRDIVPTILGSGMFRPAATSHLYLWATNNFLQEAMQVLDELGFRYLTCLTWAKPHAGLGQYFRGQTEHLLFGVRGHGIGLRRQWTSRRDLPTLLHVDHPRDARGRAIHSAKPEEFYNLIEAASPPSRLEMFARRRRPGWAAWGNEIVGKARPA
jgi:N6-adenosine-specific RNA methylase IME4